MVIERNLVDSSISKLVLQKPNVIFDIELRGNITIIKGDSSTCKTFFVTSLKEYCSNNYMILFQKFGIQDVKFLDYSNSNNNVYLLKNLKNSLIIIDNADLVLNQDKKLLEYISYDLDNQYIVMSRGGISLPVSPNHICELKQSNNRVYTEFAYNILSWM